MVKVIKVYGKEPETKESKPLSQSEIRNAETSYTIGEIVSGIPTGLAYGGAKAIADTADFVSLAMNGEGKISDQAIKLRDYFNRAAEDQIANAPGIAYENFRDHPFAKTVWNVSAAMPQLGAAYVTTLATKKPILGASLFGPPTYASFYRQARENNVPHEKAQTLAIVNAIGQVILETIPLSGLLKGGAFYKRVFRGILQEGIIEEGSQQVLENYLKNTGWGDPKNLMKDIVANVDEAIVAGSVMGAGFGMISSPSIADKKADIEEHRQKRMKVAEKVVRETITKQGEAQGKSPEEIQDAINSTMGEVNKLFTFASLKKIEQQIEKGVEENKELFLKGLIETSGGFGPATVETLNVASQLTAEVNAQARDVGQEMFTKERWVEFPQVVKDVVTGTIGNLIDAGVPLDTVKTQAQQIFEANRVFAPENIYIYGAGKHGGVPNDLKVWSPVYGEIELQDLVGKLKTFSEQTEVNGQMELVRRSIPPNKWKVHYIYPEGFKYHKNLTRRIWRVAKNIYKNNPDPEILPPAEVALNATAEVVQEHRKGKKSAVAQALLRPFAGQRAAEGKIVKDKKKKDFVSKKEAAATVEREMANLEGTEKYQKFQNLREYFKSRGVPDTVRVEPGTQKEAIQQFEQEQSGEKAPVYSVPARTPAEMLEYALNNPTVDLTENEYLKLLRMLGEQINQNQDPTLMQQYNQLFEQYQNAFPPSEAEQMFTELSGEAIDTETIGDIDLFENTDDDNARTGITKGVDAVSFKESAYVQDQDLELLKQLFTLLQDWQCQLELLGPKRELTKRGPVGVKYEYFARNLREAQETAALSQRKFPGDLNAQQLANYINEFFNQRYNEIVSQLPSEVVEKISPYNLEELSRFINDGGVISGTEMQTIKQDINRDALRGDLSYGLVFMKPTQVQVESGNIKGKPVEKGQVVTLHGSYYFQIRKGFVKLRDDVKLKLTSEEIARIVTEVNQQKIAEENPTIHIIYPNQTYLFQGGLSKANFGPDEIENATNDYRQTGAFDGDTEQQNVEIDPKQQRRQPVRSVASAIKFLVTPSAILNHFKNFVGEKKIQETLGKEKIKKVQANLNNELITPIMEDKRMQNLFLSVAQDQIRSLQLKVWEIAGKMMTQMPQFQQLKGRGGQQEVYTKLLKLMSYASQEIFSVSGMPNLYTFTELGRGGLHEDSWDKSTPDGERVAYAAKMKDFHDYFGIQYTQADLQRWAQRRDPRSYWTILGNLPNGKDIQSILVYQKAEIEHPLLMAQINAGIYKGSNMWTNINRGFTHRVFTYQEGPQKEMASEGVRQQNIKSTHTPKADFRTLEEYMLQTEAAGLVPVETWTASTIDYIRLSLSLLQQQTLLNHLKGQAANITEEVIPGFENNTKVRDLITALKLVEYENSPLIKSLAKETGLEPTKILSMLSFTKNQKAPGFANWSNKGFNQPWVYYPLSQLLDNVYGDMGGEKHPLYSLNQTLGFFKRFQTIQPLDSVFLFMSGVMVNTPVTEWFTDIAPSYVSAIGSSFKTGAQIARGEYWFGMESFEEEDYDLLMLARQQGWSTFNYEQYMKSMWDKAEIGKYPEDWTPLERYYEYGASVAGFNAAIFQKFISKKVFGVIKRRYKQFVDMGVEPKAAMRRAVYLINSTSFLLDPNTWGEEGKWHTLAWFTRNITTGTLQTMTGAAYPLFKKVGLQNMYARPLTKGLTWHQLVQNMFHGSVSHADLDFLARFYLIHIGKVMGLAALLYGGLQYALSFADDDEWDEHGDRAFGDPLAKKRFIWNNEAGKRWSIRMPFRDINQRRLYINPQFLRESSHWVQMFGGLGSDNIPNSMQKWFMNRLNSPFQMMLNVFYNYDRFENQRFIVDNKLPLKYQLQEVTSYIKEEMMPLGLFLRKEERAITGDKAKDIPLGVGEIFGLNVRRGTPAEEGVVIDELTQSAKEAALVDYFNRRKREDVEYMTTEELMDLLGPDFSRQSLRYYRKKKTRPGASSLRSYRKKQKRYQEIKEGGG